MFHPLHFSFFHSGVFMLVSLRLSLLALVSATLLSPLLTAQTPEELLARPDVKAAMQAIQANEPHFIDEQVRLCEIASPPFHEDKRAAELARLFREAGLQNVRIDHAGKEICSKARASATTAAAWPPCWR
jgi:hypothetical protein